MEITIDSRPEFTGQLCLGLLPPLWGDDVKTEVLEPESSYQGFGMEGSMRELEEIHALLDTIGAPEGYAGDRLVRWFDHKQTMMRANGHPDSCQCQTCTEARALKKMLQQLRADGDVK